MNKFLLSAKTFKKEHKFLFLALILSWIPGLILFILPALVIITDFKNIDLDSFFLFSQPIIPPIAVSLISFIACKTMPKYPKLTKWISAILNSILVIIIFGFFVLMTIVIIDFLIKIHAGNL